MVNEGRLAPVIDVVQALRDDAAGAGNNARGSSGKGVGGTEDIMKNGGNKGSKKNVSMPKDSIHGCRFSTALFDIA